MTLSLARALLWQASFEILFFTPFMNIRNHRVNLPMENKGCFLETARLITLKKNKQCMSKIENCYEGLLAQLLN
jgi:hypothetical protein